MTQSPSVDSGTVTVPWGVDDCVQLALPDGWSVIAELAPRAPESPRSEGEEIGRALREPIGLPGLTEFAGGAKSACIVIDDRTRPTPVAAILEKVLPELRQAGLDDRNIRILVATGTHRDMTDEEIGARVGAGVMDRHEARNHHMFDPGHLSPAGRTPTDGMEVHYNKWLVESDVVVSVGCIEPHENAGFGGGYKNLMPGCSGPSSVYLTHHSHFQKWERISHAGMPRERNRFRRVIDECGALLGPKVFIVNTLMEGKRAVAAVAGDPVKAHAAGCDLYRKMASVRLGRPGDVVIAGARPLDADLRVTTKSCFNASAALKPGGVLISISAVPDGLGDLRMPKGLPLWFRHVVKTLPPAVVEPLIMRLMKSPDQAAGLASLVKLVRTSAAWLVLVPDASGTEPLQALGIEFFTDANALLARAKAIKPRAEVVVMPHAGATFVAWE